MTLNYWRIVKRYPKWNGVLGGSIHDCEIFSLLDGKTTHMTAPLFCSKEYENKNRRL